LSISLDRLRQAAGYIAGTESTSNRFTPWYVIMHYLFTCDVYRMYRDLFITCIYLYIQNDLDIVNNRIHF